MAVYAREVLTLANLSEQELNEIEEMALAQFREPAGYYAYAPQNSCYKEMQEFFDMVRRERANMRRGKAAARGERQTKFNAETRNYLSKIKGETTRTGSDERAASSSRLRSSLRF